MVVDLLQISAALLWAAAAAAVETVPAARATMGRLSEAEWGSYHEIDHQGPGTYAFGYDVDDAATGNTQFRQEERHPNGTVTGSYGMVLPDGSVQVVHYVADGQGYRVSIENSYKHRTVNGQPINPARTPLPAQAYQTFRPEASPTKLTNSVFQTIRAQPHSAPSFQNTNAAFNNPKLYSTNQGYQPLNHPFSRPATSLYPPYPPLNIPSQRLRNINPYVPYSSNYI